MSIPGAENYRLAFPFQVPRRSGTAVCERAGVTVINPQSVTMVASCDIAGLLIRVLRAASGQRSCNDNISREPVVSGTFRPGCISKAAHDARALVSGLTAETINT